MSRSQPRLLAEPEFARGAISAGELLGRIMAMSASDALPARYDLEVALLRLEPGVGQDFWTDWSARDAGVAAVARRMYEEGHQHIALAPVISMKSDPETGNIDQPPVSAKLTTMTESAPESDTWSVLITPPESLGNVGYPRQWRRLRYEAIVSAWPLLCPWQPELAAAHLLRPLSDGLRPGHSPATCAVACLADPGHPLGTIGHLALMTGLASGAAETRIVAAEVWASAAQDGRLDPRLAASALVLGVGRGAFKLNRVADAFQHAFRQPIAGSRVIQTVFAAADSLVAAKPANLHLLLEVTARIGALTGLPEIPSAISSPALRSNENRLGRGADS